MHDKESKLLERNYLSNQASETEIDLQPEHIAFLSELVRCRADSWFDGHGEKWTHTLNEDYKIVLAQFRKFGLIYEPVQTRTGGCSVSRKGARIVAEYSEDEEARAAARRKRFPIVYRKK